MVAMRVRRIAPGDNTIRLHPCVTTPFNADFDGDEMNVHVPQDEMSRAELSELMALEYNVLSDATGYPSLCMIQDGLVAMRHLSLPDSFLNRSQVFQLAMQIHFVHKHPSQKLCLIGEDGADDIDSWGEVPFDARRLPQPCILKPERLWSGKQIISLLLPYINIDKGTDNDEASNFKFSNKRLLIRDGELLCGVLTKEDLGRSNHSILQVTAKDIPNGGRHALNFLSDAQRLVEYYWIDKGFSVGLDDITVTPHTQDLLDQMIQATYDKVEDIYKVVDSLKFDVGSTDYFDNYKEEAAEKAVTIVLQRALVHAGDIINAELEHTNNSLHIMACRAKSKGSISNLSQIIALLGQQLQGGHRIQAKGEGKTIPSQIPNSRHPRHRGMIVNGFQQRPTPSEFFYHCISSREGLTDTSCKTSETGYLERKLMKACESIVVHTDGSVRSHGGQTDEMSMIIVSRWGGDGFRCAYLEEVEMAPLMKAANADLADLFCSTTSTDMDARAAELCELTRLRDATRAARSTGVQSSMSTIFTVPMDTRRLVQNVLMGHRGTNFDAAEAVDAAKKKAPMISHGRLVELFHKFQNKVILTIGEPASVFVCAHVCSVLSSRNVLDRWKLEEHVLTRILSKYLTCIKRSLVPYGEAVGALTAHGIGEPTTQLTLNTYVSSSFSLILSFPF